MRSIPPIFWCYSPTAPFLSKHPDIKLLCNNNLFSRPSFIHFFLIFFVCFHDNIITAAQACHSSQNILFESDVLVFKFLVFIPNIITVAHYTISLPRREEQDPDFSEVLHIETWSGSHDLVWRRLQPKLADVHDDCAQPRIKVSEEFGLVQHFCEVCDRRGERLPFILPEELLRSFWNATPVDWCV